MAKDKSKSKSAVIEADDELELIEDDEETPKASKAKGKGKSAPKETASAPKSEPTGMGVSWLAEYVNEELGTEYTPAQVRVVLRKMATDGDLERSVGTDRARYQFTGEKDPTVRALLKRMRNGEADTARKERLEAAKSGSSKKAKNEDDEEPKAAKGAKRRKSDEDAEEEKPRPAARRRRKSEED